MFGRLPLRFIPYLSIGYYFLERLNKASSLRLVLYCYLHAIRLGGGAGGNDGKGPNASRTTLTLGNLPSSP